MISARTCSSLRSWSLIRSISNLQSSIRLYHGLRHSKSFQISDEVREAIATGKPVVALETTIYTHGFPYPDNVALASLLESVVRTNGGVPATIGILNGVARVGLEAEELVQIASAAQNQSALKVSRRDLGYICGLGLAGRGIHGGTTISGTMVLAHLAGIKIFGTGGLGGVHRGGESSMDISADLTELGRTPVTVISSGCKSFLDIPRTLEYLETEGVLVGTFADGRTGPIDFPAFFSRDSGIKSPKVIRDEAEAAAIIYAQSQLSLTSGIHFANPVPEEASVPKSEMDRVVEEAVRLADVEGYHGSDNTPFILTKIKELSGSKSIVANRALVESNVKRATKIAVELAKLELSVGDHDNRPVTGNVSRHSFPVSSHRPKLTERLSQPPDSVSRPIISRTTTADIMVAGSLAIDFACDYAPFANAATSIEPVPHTSNPAVIGQSLGGVGHNVALAAHYIGGSVLFCSVVADDLSGRAALSSLEKEGLSCEGIQVLSPSAAGARTAQYVAINDSKKDLILAMADMGIVELPEHDLDFDAFYDPLLTYNKPKWVVLDANWSPDVLSKWIGSGKRSHARIAFEPVSVAKATRLFAKNVIGPTDCIPHDHKIHLATPNALELAAMYQAARDKGLFDSPEWWSVIDSLGMSSSGSRDRLVSITSTSLVDKGVPQQAIQLLPFIPCIITKLGPQGVLLSQILRPGDDRLASPNYTPYVVARSSTIPTSSDQTSLIGGLYMRLFPPDRILTESDITSVNGAGDTLLGVLVAGLARTSESLLPAGVGLNIERIISVAQQASLMTLQSPQSVSRDIEALGKRLNFTGNLSD